MSVAAQHAAVFTGIRWFCTAAAWPRGEYSVQVTRRVWVAPTGGEGGERRTSARTLSWAPVGIWRPTGPARVAAAEATRRWHGHDRGGRDAADGAHQLPSW